MKKRASILTVFFVFISCFIVLPSSYSAKAHRAQPYENAERWSWNLPIRESGYCGPASLYHVINYFGDYGSYYYRVKNLYKTYWGSGTIDLPRITASNLMLISETAFGLFIQPSQNGSGWSLLDNISDLYYTKDLNDRVYNVYVCSKFSKTNQVEVRRKRLDYILENVLENDTPVIVHLHSGIYGFGHYITLVGYDKAKGEVYYVDSLQSEEGIIAVSVEDFIGSRFYKRGGLYSARWDGEWMAFWHKKDETLCDRCGE